MCRVFMISDLHLGHEGALQWAREYREGNNAREMNEWLISQWNSVVTKRDLVWVLGDVCMKIEDMECLDRMNGTKKLILGNHDKFDYGVYKKYFKQMYAYTKYKGFWLSHMPVHTNQAERVRGNIHGHLHQNLTGENFHYNVCVEHCKGVPIEFKRILEYHVAVNGE